MRNHVQLITYADRLAGTFRGLHALIAGPLRDVFGGIHLLPFFHPIDGADAGFDPIDHTRPDERLGCWRDVADLGSRVELMADLIVNHVSSRSPQFLDVVARGTDSPWARMFLTLADVFPEGAREADLLAIYRPRPGLPFTSVGLRNGERRLFWTTFTPEQLDIHVDRAESRAYFDSILREFHAAGITAIRLDAAGYAVKKAGTRCFMIPETYEFIGEFAARARRMGMEVLVEIHSHYLEQIEIAARVDRVYDFALPPLVLHALFEGTGRYLRQWLAISPRNAVTVLDTHDGIGVIDVGPDRAGRPGLLPPEEIDRLVETIHRRSGGTSRQATGAAASNLDLYQVNCTFFDALGGRETEYLIARAVQFFAPGVPQVYYVGLLAGGNDMDLLARTRVGRDINRHYYTAAEVAAHLVRPVVRRLIELIRFRNAHPAFGGAPEIGGAGESELLVTWRHGADWARLEVDFAAPRAAIAYSSPEGARELRVEAE